MNTNIFERFCFAFLLHTHSDSHKQKFVLWFLSRTDNRATSSTTDPSWPNYIYTILPLLNQPIEQTALIGVDGVIYINVRHFSSFAQFAFHFFGSLNCRRHVIYWPSVLGLGLLALDSRTRVPAPLLTLFCMFFSLFNAFCCLAESALCDV